MKEGTKSKFDIAIPATQEFPELLDLKLILQNLNGALAVIDAEGKILFVNCSDKSCQTLLQANVDVGQSIFDSIPPEWHPMARMMISDIEAKGLPISIDLQSKGTHQSKLFFELTCKSLSRTAAVKLFLIQLHEMTATKIFQKKIESMGFEMSNLIQNANAIIIGTDASEHITEWNKTAADITGYTSHDALTRKLSDLMIDDSDPVQSTRAIRDMFDGKALSNFELTVRAKDGRKLIFLINGTPKLNGAARVIGSLIVGQDITELIAYRNSLESKVELRTKELNKSYQEIKLQKSLADDAQKKSEQLLLNILPTSVANELKENGHVAPRKYDTTSILFADMAGFTELSSKLTPEMVVYELNYIFTGFDMILERNNMEKIKTIGDGYMAVGGLPVKNSTNAHDAVNAALQMVSFIQRLKKENQKSGRPPWAVRIGIHTGGLVAGIIGKNKFAYDIWGSSVNIASRIESASEPERVNISESTYQAVKDEFDCAFRGEIPVKSLGKVNMYFVNGKTQPK